VEKKQDNHFLRLAGRILGTTALISLAVLLLGFLLHWSQPVQYSNAFFIAGAALIVLGLYTVTAGYTLRGDAKILFAETMNQANLAERNQRTASDMTQRYGTMIYLFVTGLLMILIAVGIGSFFNPS